MAPEILPLGLDRLQGARSRVDTCRASWFASVIVMRSAPPVAVDGRAINSRIKERNDL